ncbi:MAG: hypothetical protein BWY66_00080 [bacterium ADurb.Bin374]|nr:MAG: hypothetical protein BWY66_00080 [bacterium ADurb.Bin374]
MSTIARFFAFRSACRSRNFRNSRIWLAPPSLGSSGCSMARLRAFSRISSTCGLPSRASTSTSPVSVRTDPSKFRTKPTARKWQ